ncbi:uncharacterized protein MELLADRAFT_110218 [Melampsora larici-populina 98AG31]|uniref:Uncharacterized protein n=1 Tax=Melampsora larici-populina (strain 98AG31 / pathotype 3-4-7) TaxID=747676 RepID=F4RZ23_MELLP|nr:uncharacterized protein MELLADRAFT_110218 [Melampsora larici-populina 98AG31]EGG02398.1 hypothetical protein MELLADRAFT_110218 [Melampsora larici-populina 98AG31]
MPPRPRQTASLSAILTTTSDATLLRLPPGGVAWHKSETHIVFKGPEGQPVLSPLTAYGYVMADDALTRHQTYHIHGAVGVDLDDGAAFIKHSSITQSLVATIPPEPVELAGKAMISSIGKVQKVAFDNVNEDGEWQLTVQAEHEIFNPEDRKALHFPITYCFGYFSPGLSEMGDIEINTLMWFVGTVDSKDLVSNQLIVQVLEYGIVGS